MPVVPYIFADESGQIPLSQLDVNFANVKAFATTAGFVTNNAQSNITSVGTLVALTVTGNVVAPYFLGNVVGNLTGNIIGSVSATGNITGGNINTNGRVVATGNVTGGNITTIGAITATGNITGGNIAITEVNASGNIFGNVIQGLAFRSNVGVFSVPLGVTDIKLGNDRPTTVYMGGNASNVYIGNVNSNTQIAGNLITGGDISTAGNINAGNINGTIVGTITTPSVSASGNITGGNLLTGGLVSATGNISGGNLLTGGQISSTSTITSAANITGGNLLSNGVVTAAGNITGSYFIGNGSLLTGVSTSSNAALLTGTTLSSNVINSSITSLGTLVSLSVTGNVTANNFVGSGAGTPTISSNTALLLSSPSSVRVQGGGTFRLPSLTQTQINALTPSVGDMVYNTTTGYAQIYVSTGWGSITLF